MFFSVGIVKYIMNIPLPKSTSPDSVGANWKHKTKDGTNEGSATLNTDSVNLENSYTDNSGVKIDTVLKIKFPDVLTNFFTMLNKIPLPGSNTGDGKQMTLGNFVGQAYGRIAMFGGGLVSGVKGLISGMESGNFGSIAKGLLGTVTSLVGFAFPGTGLIMSKVVSFISGLFGGKKQKSPEQIISEQIGALHKAMMKGFKIVVDNQKLILKNMATGFKNVSRDIKLDGQLTRNAIAGVSDKIDRSTEIIIDQIDNLRIELSDSIFGLQSSFNLNFGLLSLQLSDSVMSLKKDLSEGFSLLQKNLSNNFSFLRADFNDFKFDNKLEFAELKTQLADIKNINLDIKDSIGLELENVLKLRELDLLSAGNFAISKIQGLSINANDIIAKMQKETIAKVDDLYEQARRRVAAHVSKLIMQGAEIETNKLVNKAKELSNETLDFLKKGGSIKVYYYQKALNEQRRKLGLPEIARTLP